MQIKVSKLILALKGLMHLQSILLISHDLHVVMSATDYVVCLNGHVCCSGTPQAVANDNKYKELFGDRASTILSVYEHNHDHTHSPDGSIKRKQ